MNQQKLLIIDDEPHMIWLLRESFKEEFNCLGANGQREAISIMESEHIDMVILDLRLNNGDGVETLKEIKKLKPSTPVIIITAYASVSTAVETMKYGAFDYLTKPFNIEEMRLLVKKALQLSPQTEGKANDATSELSRNKIIAESKEMLKVWQLVQKVAPTEANVLITGESGTGKELIARAIHYESPRHKMPYVAINCAALPENLLESELFGYEEGAFTGARGTKPGKFELAHGGTLLLDEIGDMELNTQVKILRVLEEKVVDRLGSTKPTPVNVRIIASTNKDLSYLVQKGKFREDLYFRLAVFPILLPALRERAEDIPILANHLLSTFAGKYGKTLKGYHPSVINCFLQYTWPGNVRELRNVVEQLVIMSDGPVIKAEDIPPSLGVLSSLLHSSHGHSGINNTHNIRESRDSAEIRTIKEALTQCEGNRTRAAQLLGISRRTLQLKIKKYQL